MVYLQSLCLKIEITIFIKTKVRGLVFINKLLDKIKEYKNKKIEKRINKIKKNKKDIYLSKGILKKKVQNSQCFTNIKDISDNGIITLKNGGYALMYSANPIDLSLTSDKEQNTFFHILSKLYRLPFTIKAYKFDEKINLNVNKENYLKLIDETDNEVRKNILINNHNFIEAIESENMTSAILVLLKRTEEGTPLSGLGI